MLVAELVVGAVELVVFATVLVAELVVGAAELVDLVELVVEATVSVAEDTVPVALARVDELSAEAPAAQIVLAPSVRMLTTIARSQKRSQRIPVLLPLSGRHTLVRDGESEKFHCQHARKWRSRPRLRPASSPINYTLSAEDNGCRARNGTHAVYTHLRGAGTHGDVLANPHLSARTRIHPIAQPRRIHVH